MAVSDSVRPRNTDRMLGLAVRLAVALVVALVGIAILTVYFDRRRDLASTPAARLERELQAAVNKNPRDPAPRAQLAAAYIEMLRFDDAIKVANEAVKLKRDYPRSHLVLGLAWLNKKEWPSAERAFAEVIELSKGREMSGQNPELEQAYFYTGVAKYRQKDWDGALQHFRMALSMNRASADTLYFIGDIYLRRNANDLAASALEDAVAYDPQFVDAQYALGRAYERLKQRTLAAEHYRLAWEASDRKFADAKTALDKFGSATQHLEAGKKSIAAGKLAAGVRELELSLALDPASANASFALGQAYEKQAAAARGAKEKQLRTELAHGMYKKVKELVAKYPGVDAALKRTAARSSK